MKPSSSKYLLQTIFPYEVNILDHDTGAVVAYCLRGTNGKWFYRLAISKHKWDFIADRKKEILPKFMELLKNRKVAVK